MRRQPLRPNHIYPATSGLDPSPEPHLKAIRKYIEAGFDHLVLTQIGPEQDPFFEFFKSELRHSLSS